MPPRRRKRLDPASFSLPVETIAQGVYSDRPAQRVREILCADGKSPVVLVQVSSKRSALVAGIDEAIALLKLCVRDWSALTVHGLYDGDRVDAWETVLTIHGPYDQFAHIEPLCVGVLSRRTRVSTNARLFVDAARSKPVMVFSARHDHWLVQPGDALAAQIGGAFPVSSDMQPGGRNAPRVGLVPHALIASYGGDTALAARKFAEHTDEALQIVVPVDYQNDSARTALEVARAVEARLWGVQLATSELLVDRSILPQMGAFQPTGVNPQLVWEVRNALDAEGYGEIKLLASGGITVERIRQFEEDGIPVDAYGVGPALLADEYAFSATVVQADGATQTRAGRERRENPRLDRVK